MRSIYKRITQSEILCHSDVTLFMFTSMHVTFNDVIIVMAQKLYVTNLCVSERYYHQLLLILNLDRATCSPKLIGKMN